MEGPGKVMDGYGWSFHDTRLAFDIVVCYKNKFMCRRVKKIGISGVGL